MTTNEGTATDQHPNGVPVHPALFAPSVAAQMARDTAEDDGAIEIGWVARSDAGGRIVEVKLVARGNNSQCPLSARDAIAGGWSWIWHSHPKYAQQPRPFPSERDITSAMECASVGVGFGIVNWNITDAFVARYPSPPKAPDGADTWTFKLGRWSLIATRPHQRKS